MTKQLLTEIEQRWSPRAFRDSLLSEEAISLLLEAARWAPSCANEQPWHFLVYAKNHVSRSLIENYLAGGNYWAKTASHLIVACANTRFEGNDKPNRHAYYDTGAAVLSMVLQAQHMGIAAHQMAGFDHEQLEKDLAFGEHVHAVSVIAVGMASDDLSSLSEKHQQVENSERQRKSLDKIVQYDVCKLG